MKVEMVALEESSVAAETGTATMDGGRTVSEMVVGLRLRVLGSHLTQGELLRRIEDAMQEVTDAG